MSGFSILLNEKGVATFEFPHVLNLVNNIQFDTIYHEHYSYLSLISVKTIFEANGLSVFDVDEFPTHGGSLRIYAQRADIKSFKISDSVYDIYAKEIKHKINKIDFYRDFQKNRKILSLNYYLFL